MLEEVFRRRRRRKPGRGGDHLGRGPAAWRRTRHCHRRRDPPTTMLRAVLDALLSDRIACEAKRYIRRISMDRISSVIIDRTERIDVVRPLQERRPQDDSMEAVQALICSEWCSPRGAGTIFGEESFVIRSAITVEVLYSVFIGVLLRRWCLSEIHRSRVSTYLYQFRRCSRIV